MSSIFSIFDLGARGMYAQQAALQVTGHNIANANTENYVRQRAELRESMPVDATPGPLGSGVDVREIVRIKNDFTDYQVRKEKQNMGYLDEKSEILQEMENIFNEPSENGLNTLINNFYDSLSDLSNHPEDYSARVMVREQALAMTDVFNQIDTQLSELQDNMDEKISYNLNEINSMAREIADLNNQISKSEVSGTQNANDLRNRRDALLRDLSEMGDVFVSEGSGSLVNVQFGDQLIVSGVDQIALKASKSLDGATKIVTNTGYDVNIRNGSMKALFEMRDEVIESYKDDLDSLAHAIADDINKVHIGGVGLTRYESITSENSVNGSGVPLANAGLSGSLNGGSFTLSLYDTNGNLTSENVISVNPLSDTLADIASAISSVPGFSATITGDRRLSIATSSPTDTFSFVSDSSSAADTSGLLNALGLNTFFKGTDARSITVSDTIINDVNKIAAATTTASGDNSNALKLLETRDEPLVEGATFEDFYSSMIGGLGVDRQVVESQKTTQGVVLQSLLERQQTESGVSFDEEAINLIKFQRGYQASAKFIQVVDGLINSLLSMV